MASTNSRLHNKKRTRLQDRTEKRIAEEELRQEAEFKRQKKIFRIGDVIGPRDVIVHSNLSNIEQKTDTECSPILKQQPVEIESSLLDESHDGFCSSKIKLEVDSSLVVKVEEKVEETLELEVSTFEETLRENDELIEHTESYATKVDIETIFSETEKRDYFSETAVKVNHDKFMLNHVKILKSLNDQKDHEIYKLIEVIKGLQLQLHASDNTLSDNELEKEQFVSGDSNFVLSSTSENAKIVAKLSSNLMGKHNRIGKLSMKVFQLQDQIYGTTTYSLEMSKNCEPPGSGASINNSGSDKTGKPISTVSTCKKAPKTNLSTKKCRLKAMQGSYSVQLGIPHQIASQAIPLLSLSFSSPPWEPSDKTDGWHGKVDNFLSSLRRLRNSSSHQKTSRKFRRD